MAPTVLPRPGMDAHAYRSLHGHEPRHAPRGLDREVLFVGVILWLAALVDVAGIVEARARFTGLHAVALVAFAALSIVWLREAAARVAHWLGAPRG